MKLSLKKNLGVLLIIVCAFLLILPAVIPALQDLLDHNIYTAGLAFLIIVGLIAHIVLNKYLPLGDDESGKAQVNAASEEN